MENICKQEIFDSVKAYYKLNSIGSVSGPKYGPERPPASSNAAANSQDGARAGEPEPEEEEEKVEDPFTVWQGDEIKHCEDLVYVLKLTNTTDNPVKFRMDFKAGTADVPNNLVWPREGLLGSIGPNEINKVVAVLGKLTPTACEHLSELQKLQVTLTTRVDEEQKAANAASNEQQADNKNAGGGGNKGTNEDKHD